MKADSFVKSSFGVLLRLREVIQPRELITRHLTLEQRSPSVKNKLDSIMARLGPLCLEGNDSALQDSNQCELWAKLSQ